jgi:AcrR family transcriptional regulator
MPSATVPSPSPKKRKSAAKTPSRSRLSPEERERKIVEGAIAYFSEVGFSGQTRELSRQLGITQPLLYRYFPSKQALIERVFKEVFLGRWNPRWLLDIQDGSRSLHDRLLGFYQDYARATYRPEWIRIYMYAGLSDTGFNRRYIGLIQRRLLTAICRELRRHCGVNSKKPVTRAEIEFVWKLHGGMFYYAIRRFIYRAPVEQDFAASADHAITAFLAGAKEVYPALMAPPAARPARSAAAS